MAALTGAICLKGQQSSASPVTSQNSDSVPPATTTAAQQGLGTTTVQSSEFDHLLFLAQSGDIQSELAVANAYYYGRGVSKNLPEAYRWSLKAANQGNARAESTVAWYYDHGVVVTRDDAEALRWMLKAAQDGDADSQVEMGARYQAGRGVPLDLTQAVEWYRKAATQNNDKGETALGYALMTGRGTPQNLKSGFAYLYLASEKNAYARFAIAHCYADGVFVERDPVEAYRWCLLALELDQQANGLAETLKSQLSTDQIAQAAKGVVDFHRLLKDHDMQTDSLSIVFTGDSPVTIPFDFLLGHIVIPIQINDQRTEYLAVDTGSHETLLDDGIADRLKIKSNRYMPLGGLGTDNVLAARVANEINLSLPGLTIYGATAGLLPNFDLDQYLGHPLAGILGYDILSRLVVSIDYVNKKITFQKSGAFKPDATSEPIPLSNRGVSPFVQAELGSTTGAGKGWFLVDTGDGNCMMITKSFQDANPQIKIEQPIKTGSLGFGGINYSVDGKCSRLNLGKLVVLHPIATFLPQEGVLSNRMAGTLGEGIQARFDETFDSPEGMLYLKANAHFSDPFTYNNVGMGLKTAKGCYHTFTVFAVVPDSPAALFKFQVGDQIVRIDKADAATTSLSELYEIIQKEGVHHLAIIRAGTPKEIDLKVVKNIK